MGEGILRYLKRSSPYLSEERVKSLTTPGKAEWLIQSHCIGYNLSKAYYTDLFSPESMVLKPGVLGDAYPRGHSTYRHWLSRTWDSLHPIALVIGINPNTATESEEDGMTLFLTRLLKGLKGEYKCGGYVLVNCCDWRGSPPGLLKDVDEPCSEKNIDTIHELLVKCNFIVASWGTTKYGKFLDDCRIAIENLVRRSGKRAICFSRTKTPLYCSRRIKNCNQNWSDTPMPWS